MPTRRFESCTFARANPLGEQTFKRPANDARPVGGLIKTENLHVCDLVVVGRLVF